MIIRWYNRDMMRYDDKMMMMMMTTNNDKICDNTMVQ